jgi:hypothetical protein
MTALNVVAMVAVLVQTASQQPIPNRLEGCSDPRILAKALGALVKIDWKQTTTERAKSLWPNPLQGIDCDSDACTSTGFSGRVISGEYQCSEKLSFDVTADPGSKPKEQLYSILINYATPTREATVEATRAIISELDVPGPQREQLGNEPSQSFIWDVPGGTNQWALLINFERLHGVWGVQVRLRHLEK